MFERNQSRQSNLKTGDPSNLSTFSLFLFFVFTVALLSAVLSSTAKAQSAALASDPATLATSAEESTNGKTFAYSGQFIFETARTADEVQPTSYTGWYLLTASATHKRTALTGTLKLGYAQEYTYVRDDGTNGAVENPIAAIAKSFINGRDFQSALLDSVSLSVSGSIGANRESARRHFLWSNGVLLTGAKVLGSFNLRQSVGYTHSFFEYDIRNDGTVNSPDSMKSITSLYYDVNPRLSIGGAFTYQVARSFQGVTRGSQQAQATADYMITEKIAASIGIASDRTTLEPDGQSDRIRFYAPEAAQYFVDLLVLL